MTIVTWRIDNLGLSPGIPRSPYFFLESPRISLLTDCSFRQGSLRCWWSETSKSEVKDNLQIR